ncbi:MAG: TRAP transporter small permease [Pseudomonadota bacterium]
MRRALDTLYVGAGVLSGLFLVGIAVTIIAQVVGRMAGFTIDSTETAGFCLAASTFLGLAYTLRRGGHIRVTLAIRHAGPTVRKVIEGWCLLVAAGGMAYFLYWSVDLVWFSWRFDEVSPGLMAIPFWIPRLAMAVGALILLIALLDDFVGLWLQDEPSYEANAERILPTEDEVGPSPVTLAKDAEAGAR